MGTTKKLKQRFETFMEATGIDGNKDISEERKVAILLHTRIIGDEVQEIFDTQIKGDWKKVLEVLEKYFIPTSKSINANAVHCDSEEKEGMFLDMICCNERKIGIIRKSWFQNVLINGCVIPCKLQLTAVEVTAPSVKLTNYNGSPITELYGEVKVKCEVNGIEDVETFQVVQLNTPCIIGLDFCVKYGLLQRCQVNSVEKSVSKSLEQLIMKCKDTFGGIGEINKHRIKIRRNAEPLAEAPTKIPVGVQEGLKIELERMARLGVCRKVSEPTEWVSSLVIVKKPDNSLLICLDPQNLNKSIIRERYQLPTFNAGKYGRWCYKRLPFGICSAPEVFQKTFTEIFGDLPGVQVYIDDILVYANNEEEHLQRLTAVFERAKAVNVRFNESKCKFGVKQVKYLGQCLVQKDFLQTMTKYKQLWTFEDQKVNESCNKYWEW